MLRFANLYRTTQLSAVLLFATACGDGGSNDPNGGSGGSPSACDADETTCGDGFECDDSGDEIGCVDVDECADGTDDCDDDSFCVNKEGSFSCEACPAGYELDGDECVDVDECEEGTDSCDEHASCENTDGSYDCRCDDGFDGDGDECVDVDECADGTNSCDEHASCENTDGSYDCRCDDGFEGDGEECTDIDECAEGTDDCDNDSFCVNNEGSFSCEPCSAGYELDGDECVDADECEAETDSCDEDGSCENTEGSYECTCNEGFEGNGEECNDIDECEEGLAECDDDLVCVNNEGSFSCEPCPAGYELDGDECVAMVPHVVASTPEQGADDVYPSQYHYIPIVGVGIRERVLVHLTFDREMSTEEATVVVTDEDGLEEPRAILGTWDETGHILIAVISAHGGDSYPALFDETTYNVSFGDLQSSFGIPVDQEDPSYPGAVLAFTTGFRDPIINHACIHTQNGPNAEVTALSAPESWAPGTDQAHYHYTIEMPEGSDVGYTSYFPNNTGFFRFYARGTEELQLGTSILDFDTLELGPWSAIEIEEAPPACPTVDTILTDPETGESTLGPPVVGITHQFTLNLDEENYYLLRWMSPEDAVQIIVEYAGEEL